MEFLLVFVCCLVLALSVLGMMKCVKQTTGHQRQQDIINVAENIYVSIRQGDIKKCNVVEMTAFLLKLGKSTVLKLLVKYYKKSVDEVCTPRKTRKKRPQEGKSVGAIDDFTMNTIRNAIYRMYSEGCVNIVMYMDNLTGLHVTVDTVFKEIQERQIDFYGGRTTLCKFLKEMEFSWTIVDGRKAIIENENTVLPRIDFLRKYKEEKEKGAHFIFVDETWIFQKGTVSKAWQDSTPRAMKRRCVGEGKRLIVVNAGGRSGFMPEAGLLFVSGQKTADYHGEMNGGTFLKWLEDMLVHLEEPSIIVIDNASYHSTQFEKTPITNWSKGEIIEWLEKRNINHQKNLLKVELLRLAKVHKPQIRCSDPPKMQHSILVLMAGLALCSAVSHYQLLGPWTTLPEEPVAVLAPEYGQPDVARTYDLLMGRVRARRSLQPGAPTVGGGAPGGQPNNNVDVSVTRERGVGTVVDAQGRGNVWRSNDGNTRVDAQGRWTRVYDGPARGQRSHSAGVVFSHRWR